MTDSQSSTSTHVPLDGSSAEKATVSSPIGAESKPQTGDTGAIDAKAPDSILHQKASNTMECPICGEEMVTLLQLNQHIDDSHGQKSPHPKIPKDRTKEIPKDKSKEMLKDKSKEIPKDRSKEIPKDRSKEISQTGDLADSPSVGLHTPERRARAGTQNTTPSKRSIKLDLYDDSGFGISEMLLCNEKLTRTHWRKPHAGKSNVCQDCGKPLNVKNGIVNCRKCGELFCSEHSKYVAKLANAACSQEPVVYDSQNGKFSQVCRGCFCRKPLLVSGPQANSVDLTKHFISHRARAIERVQISRQVIVHRYIKLVDILTQALQEGRLRGVFSYMDSRLAAQEKDIVPWEVDRDVSHCRICFEKFSMFSRKHHCRLCGNIVNEISRDPASNSGHVPRFCSVQVPVPLLLAKLPGLNYSPSVRSDWARCVQESCDGYSFRCCKTCKDLLVGPVRTEGPSRDVDNVIAEFNSFLRKKSSILVIISRYKALVQENSDKNNARINKLRSKLSECSRDLEAWLRAFTGRHFQERDGKLVARDPARDPAYDLARDQSHVQSRDRKLISNVHAAAIMFLQDTLLEVKQWNDEFRASEKQRLAEQTRHVQEEPSLTKRQIRELREQLMVLNEQQFIVQNSIDAAKKARRFDEVVVLEENEGELKRTIAHVTNQLGEHAFTT